MKTHKHWMVAAAILMVFTLPLAWAADVVMDSATTAVTVELTGDLSWGTDLVETLQMTFGTHPLPYDNRMNSYTSTQETLSLRVEDNRKSPTPWEVHVQLSSFQKISGSGSFQGTIHMALPQPPSAGPQTLFIVSDGGAIEVVSGKIGTLELSWLGENVTLQISGDQAKKVDEGEYQATLIWTLSAEP